MDVVLGVTPVTLSIQISQLYIVLLLKVNAYSSRSYFARDEVLTPAWGLVVKQNAVASKHVVRFPAPRGHTTI